jgi:hypothetical protein
LVEAYKWAVLAGANIPPNDSGVRNEVMGIQDEIAKKLSKKQIREAQDAAADWKPANH